MLHPDNDLSEISANQYQSTDRNMRLSGVVGSVLNLKGWILKQWYQSISTAITAAASPQLHSRRSTEQDGALNEDDEYRSATNL